MEVLDYIFLLSLLSSGSGENIIYCSERRTIPTESTVQLALRYRSIGIVNYICFWKVNFGDSNQEIRIDFNEFRLNGTYNCLYEYLEFDFPNHKEKNMKFCGTSYPKELQLTSVKDDYFQIIHYTLIHYYVHLNITVKKDLIMASKVSELTVGDKPMYIYSPGYPGTYYKYSNITWQLTAKDTTSRIMFEFLWLKMEKDCIFDFIVITGDKTNYRTCGYKSRFLVAANDSHVRMTFESDGFAEYEGFVVKYYTVPYPEYKESCVREGLKLTAIPYQPQMLTVIKTNQKDCSWNIEPDAKHKDHVIVFEVISYYTSTFNCHQRLYLTDKFSTKQAADYYHKYLPSANITNVGGTISNCINKAVQYYRSMSSSINIRLVDSSESFSNVIGNMTFSYYSLPRDVYRYKGIHIGYRPSYIWLLHPNRLYVGDTDYKILLEAVNGCIKLKLLDERMRFLNDNIGNYIEIHDGDTEKAQDLVNGCDEKRNGSVISGTKPYMFIKIKDIMNSHPQGPMSIQLYPKLLEITSTDECQGFMQKIEVPISPGFVKIYSPKYSRSVPKNLLCHYEVSASDKNAVISIQGRSNYRNIVTCTDKVYFYNSGTQFYSWCFTRDFSKLTSYNKIRFTLQTDDDYDFITYSITVTQNITKVTTLAPGQCNGIQTLKPQVGLNYTITSPNYPQDYPLNLRCEWLILAPGGYEITLTIKHAKLAQYWIGCSDTLNIYKGKNRWIEFKVFDFCAHYPHVNDRKFVSDVFLLEFLSDSRYVDTGFEVIYSLVKTSYEAYISLTLREQTFTFDSSWETYGIPIKRRFIKPDEIYPQYRIVLYISGVDKNFCRIGSISFANVITDAEYKEDYDLCKSVRGYTTLYGSGDEVLMNIFADKDYFDPSYSISVVYHLEKIPDCSPGRPLLLFAEEDFDTLTSPNYPGHYSNNQYCQWKILASDDYVLYLEVVFSDLGYSSSSNYRDYVAIFDGSDRYSSLLGRFTGFTRDYYTSTSNVVFIEFYSDATQTNTGFKIQFRKEKKKTNSMPSGSNTNSVAIIAGCIAALIFILVFCIVCGVCCKRKRVNRRRERDRRSSMVYNSSNNTVFVLSPVISNNTTALPPPPYSALDIIGLAQTQTPADDTFPPPYSELPSYEESQQFEIPNSRSFSPDNILNSTMESRVMSSEQLYASAPQLFESEDELYQVPSDQLEGIDNPAMSELTSTIV
ncbi:hypothetical protein LOTGIDRAFT_171032 [Lottia gigantea]|uniref:CUB domain-containing protein n=1 Tax=Lottia gigantea TaxID=225164 RepID=V4BEH6_LOTGI|nr:hypothetical protein LOTGIDRAFT_171032 [Lottia gigantea]ESP04192.1 hypothetical protein LOTGIDRAFT_171032 [Lottia gigantea]